MSVSEYENEPIRGLPEYLPAGERLLWQGEPSKKLMALRVFHVRKVGIYLAALFAIHLFMQFRSGGSLTDILLGSSWMLGLAAAGVGILAGLSYIYARSTVYTITDKRVVLRFGVAMPMMVNLPLSVITSADMKRYGDGSGDVILTAAKRKRLSYMLLWPNIKPWTFNPVSPSLRCLDDVDAVAQCLAQAASAMGSEDSLEDDQPMDEGLLAAS